MLPTFNTDGLLPPGDYRLTLDQLRNSFLVTGEGVCSSCWDTQWRRWLIDNLETLASQLWQVGIQRIFVNGSFVEDKDHPNDIDGYFECSLDVLKSGELQRKLNALDPHKVWTWTDASRRPGRGTTKRQLPMWPWYHVELYPHVGLPSGILDEHGNQQLFPAAFRRQRSTYKLKGIVELVRKEDSF